MKLEMRVDRLEACKPVMLLEVTQIVLSGGEKGQVLAVSEQKADGSWTPFIGNLPRDKVRS